MFGFAAQRVSERVRATRAGIIPRDGHARQPSRYALCDPGVARCFPGEDSPGKGEGSRWAS